MKNSIYIGLLIMLFVSCGKGKGASDRAMKIVSARFAKCHLCDSLGDSNITHLWSEYDSKHNSILCFHYGGCAVEYFYHEYENDGRRDTFIIKNGQPFVDDLKETYEKMTNKEYLSIRLNDVQRDFMDGFDGYFKEKFPHEEDFIEDMISELAMNIFIPE